MHNILRVAAVLAAMSEGGGGGGADPRDEEITRLRADNERLRGGRPPESDAERRRAADEQALRGRAEPETDESRQMRAEEEARRREAAEPKEERKRGGEEITRDLIRVIQSSVPFHAASSESAQRELDALRVELGDADLAAHVALRDHQRALANHNGHPATPLGSLALSKEVEDTRKALDANPVAKDRLAAIERARRQNVPVDFTQEEG